MRLLWIWGSISLMSISYAQILPDTISAFSVAPNILPLRDWKKFSYHDFQSSFPDAKLSLKHFYEPPVIPDNPFLIDMRGHPMYTPRFVSDELNLIMNRPRDNAFVPILGVAFLALQLAQKHLLLTEKKEIQPGDLAQVPEGLPILCLLWKNYPRTAGELYQDSTLSARYTMLTLQNLLSEMTENKLVRQREIDNSPLEYYPALSCSKYSDLVDRGLADSTLTREQHAILKDLRNSPLLIEISLSPDRKSH